MEIRDIYYLAALFIMAVGGITWVRDKVSERKSETDLVKQDLDNHKMNHAKLEERVTAHENKIDDKLNDLSNKMDNLKDLIIERTSK